MFGSGGSIQLARVFGIRIGVEPSWFFVLFLIIWSLSGYYEDLFPGEGTTSFALAVISALLFFGSVLLHELGHAVVAIRSGIGIQGIDLWMFGGVAKMERDTRTARRGVPRGGRGPGGDARARRDLRGDRDRHHRRGRHLGGAQLRRPGSERGGGGDRVAGVRERPAARLQPDPRLPARRRPHRPLDRVVAHRRPQQGHPLRRAAGPRVLVPDDRVRRLPALRRGDHQRDLARLRRLLPRPGRPPGRGADRDHRPDRGPAGVPT